jgi:hypothetical protein
MTWRLIFTALVDAFRFIKRYRERQAALRGEQLLERERERQHQLELMKVISSQLVEFARANNEGLLKLADASKEQAEVFKTWIEGFKPPSDLPIESSRVSEHDEWEREQKELEDVTSYLPPEFRLAAALDAADKSKDPNPHFDREGRDII